MISWALGFRFRQYAKASLWILPLFGLVCGIGLAELAAAVDDSARLPDVWQYSSATASTVLSSVVGAMIALLGFVVTIGVLVVQQATGTLSPRYMRLWYRDRLQKAVLATFTGTFAFAYTLLRSIESDSVPDLGVSLAGLAVAVSLLLLLVYLNRFTHNLRPVAIAALVVGMGETVLARVVAKISGRVADGGETVLPPGPVTYIRTEDGGILQAVDVAGLVTAATRHDCVLVLAHPVGDFVAPGAILVEVHGGTRVPEDSRVLGHVALGAERTIEQDPAFALRILVDIAVRALSPAVNDPTTAVQVLNHIEAFLHTIGRTVLHGRFVLADNHGRPRLLVPSRVWEDYLRVGVTEIREYGATSLQVCRRLRALLEGLRGTLPAEHLAAVDEELELLDDAVTRVFTDPRRRATARTADPQGIGGRHGQAHAPPG